MSSILIIILSLIRSWSEIFHRLPLWLIFLVNQSLKNCLRLSSCHSFRNVHQVYVWIRSLVLKLLILEFLAWKILIKILQSLQKEFLLNRVIIVKYKIILFCHRLLFKITIFISLTRSRLLSILSSFTLSTFLYLIYRIFQKSFAAASRNALILVFGGLIESIDCLQHLWH